MTSRLLEVARPLTVKRHRVRLRKLRHEVDRWLRATFYRRSVVADELAVGPLPDRLPESQAEKRMGATPNGHRYGLRFPGSIPPPPDPRGPLFDRCHQGACGRVQISVAAVQ